MNPEEQSLYADMRAAIRGDRERAEKRAEKKRSDPAPPQSPEPPGPQRVTGMRRLFGRRRDPS